MKNIYSIVFLLFFLFGCQKDKDNPSPGTGTTAIKSQSLTASFEGKSWSFMSGNTSKSFFKESELFFTLTDTLASDTCSLFTFGRNRILTTLPAKKGTYQLGLGGSQPTVTFYVANGNKNYVATTGTVEITSIDTVTTNLISGRMSVSYNNNFNANGNFTVKFCRR